MPKEGEILKVRVKTSIHTISEIAEISGISRAHLYTLFKQEVIEEEWKEKLKKANIFLDNLSFDSKTELKTREYILMLETKVKHLKEMNSILENQVKHLKDHNESLAKELEKRKMVKS